MKIINIILILFFLLNMQKPLLSDDNDSSLVSDTLMSKNLLNKVVTDSVNNTENLQGASFTYKYLIRIFPSPVINRARLIIYGIQNTDGKDIRLKIYDLYGKFVKDISLEANRTIGDSKKIDFTVELGNLPLGLYIVEMISNNMMTTQKFIKL